MLKPLQEKLYTDNWHVRRKWMLVSLIWMSVNVQYLVLWGHDNALHQNALITFLGAIVSILCFYIFGAVWDDRDKRAQLASLPLADPLADPNRAPTQDSTR